MVQFGQPSSPPPSLAHRKKEVNDTTKFLSAVFLCPPQHNGVGSSALLCVGFSGQAFGGLYFVDFQLHGIMEIP